MPKLTLEQIEAADAAGIKLEMTEGLPTWEFHPTPRHQIVWLGVLKSVRLMPGQDGCGCVALPEVAIEFPDGSMKRPDLSIFCEMPPELDQAVASIPSAVVEVVSRDSRRKDYELNPPFYLKHGVLDIVVIDPIPGSVAVFTKSGRKDLKSPQTLALQCGCLVDV